MLWPPFLAHMFRTKTGKLQERKRRRKQLWLPPPFSSSFFSFEFFFLVTVYLSTPFQTGVFPPSQHSADVSLFLSSVVPKCTNEGFLRSFGIVISFLSRYSSFDSYKTLSSPVFYNYKSLEFQKGKGGVQETNELF